MEKIVFLALILTLTLPMACVPPKEEILTEVNLDIQDVQLQKIHLFKDAANLDSLRPLLQHFDPSYRYASAMALGSVRDASTIDDLSVLLRDTVEEVRLAAAYSIGQIGEERGERILINNFNTTGDYNKFNGAVLEAIGRCGTEESLKFLSTIETYTPKDTALLKGQALGIYRFAYRGITVPEGTDKMVDFVTNRDYPIAPRMVASNYLYRAKDIILDSLQVSKLSKVLTENTDPRIRMALAIGIGKSKRPEAQKVLTSQFAKEQDYRVKCNIMRALGNFPYSEMQGMFFELIGHPNTKIALTAADFFYNHGDPRDARVYWRKARDLTNIPVKMSMYKVANKHMPAGFQDYKWLINNDLKLIYQDTTLGVYQRAAALRGLGEYGWNYKYLYTPVLTAREPVIRTAAAEGLAKICQDPNFDLNFGLSRRRIRKELSVYLSEFMEKGDAGVRAVTANILADEKAFKDLYENSSFLYLAKRDLELPKETETLYAIERAIATIDDKDYQPEQPAYNNPLDWSILNGVGSKSIAIINTNKGTFKMRFLPLDAPASVANFIKLAKDGFYDGKRVHRVVPNFVMQAGCPRGDGYGGLDYTLRTEVPRRSYDQEGYVGMASAGADTEGTQWFVTHSPTIHLDGNYTIFAKVIEGMSTVHKIDVGDTIESVQLSF